MTTQWQGDNPFCLVIKPEVGEPVLVDLDKPGWLDDIRDLLRAPGEWILARKAGSMPVLHLHVAEGEQPYYTARVYNSFMPPAGFHGLQVIDMADVKNKAMVKLYGIGKKTVSGHTERMWVLPSGAVCVGDDDAPFGDMLAKQRLREMLRQKEMEIHDGGNDRRREEEDAQDDQPRQADAGGGRGHKPKGRSRRAGLGVRVSPKRGDGHPALELDAAPRAVAKPRHQP